MAGAAVAQPGSVLRAGGVLQPRHRPLIVTSATLLLALAALLAWLQLSYRPPGAQVFSTEISDGEVLIRSSTESGQPRAVEPSLPSPRLPIGMAAAPSVRVPALIEPEAPQAPAAASPLVLALPPTAAIPLRPLPGPPAIAGFAAPPLAASAPQARPPPVLTVAAQPRAAFGGAGPRMPVALRAPALPAPMPAPVAARNGRAWMAYARPFAAAARQPRVAIVLWGVGRSREGGDAAIRQLPGEVTLGLTPHGHDLQLWADRARAAGHEVLLEVPMEPLSYPQIDPGKQALLTTLPEAENRRRLDRLLGVFEGYVGITNLMGSRFTLSEESLRPVLETLKARGLIFLDSRANSDSIAYRLAGEIGLDRALNNRYIDNEASAEAIDARLAELAEAAFSQGAAVGIGLPQAVTIERLQRWISQLPEMGLQLAPLSAVIDRGRRE